MKWMEWKPRSSQIRADSAMLDHRLLAWRRSAPKRMGRADVAAIVARSITRRARGPTPLSSPWPPAILHATRSRAAVPGACARQRTRYGSERNTTKEAPDEDHGQRHQHELHAGRSRPGADAHAQPLAGRRPHHVGAAAPGADREV